MPRAGEADFKSNVLSRDEKGLFGIPMKRIISSGMGAGGVYVIAKMFLGDTGMYVGFVAFIVVIILTQPKGGLPYWQRLLYSLRGSLIGAMIDHPQSLAATIGRYLNLAVDTVRLDADEIFSTESVLEDEEEAWTDWNLYPEAGRSNAKDALIIVDQPRPRLTGRTAPAPNGGRLLGSGKP